MTRRVDRIGSVLVLISALVAMGLGGPASGQGGDTPTQVPNNTFGWGRIDAKAAVDLALQTNPPIPSAPTFGRPTISGIQGNGFEQDIMTDPTNPNRLYTSVPDGLGTATSFLWRSNDAGKTFKWVPAAAPIDGAMPVCSQGGDTELAVDTAGHLYFNDLSLANFATARSDDGGAHFVFSCAGVAISPTDRQWYAVDGDPTNPGTGLNPSSSIYLTFNHFVGDPQCPAVGANELVMARSPLPGAGPDAGIHFGPVNRITGPCDEAIMGNNEVSPTTHKVFVIHDNDALNQIRIARCTPVAFGPPVAGVSDPSGLSCVDLLVAATAPGQITGANFPTMAIDKAGNLYAVWEETEAGGRTVLKYSYSLNEGTTWSTPITLPTNAPGSAPFGGTLNNNVFAWIVAGDDGRVDIAWVGTPATGASPDAANGFWSMFMTQSLNAHETNPTFTPPILVSEHHIHRGTMFTLIGNQDGNRALGDFFQIRMGAQGEALISYADSAHKNQADLMSHAMFVRQNGGPSLLESVGTVNIPGLTPTNSVTDVTNDGTFDANGSVSPNILNLDITSSRVSKPGVANCAGGVDCYRVVMTVNDLASLAPPSPTSINPDRFIQWMTTWMEPSSTNAQGGKFYHVYAESNNGAAPRCFRGESSEAMLAVVGGVNFLMTYPGQAEIFGAACNVNQATDTITIDVPVANVTVPGQIGTTLYSVTATTLTLPRAGNSIEPEQPPNLIDIAPAYDFIPAQSDLSVTKTGSAPRVATGRNLTYTVSVTNGGPDAAPDVLLTDVLPPSVTFVSVSTDLGSCGESGLTVTCSLGTLGSGATATVTIVVKPRVAGVITNTASVTSLASDPNSANDSASLNTSVCRITSRRSSIPCP